MAGTKKIDEYTEFLPLEKLYKKFTLLAGEENVFEIGKSKNKEKILCTKLGVGKKTALIFGYPHPNEPVGSLTCLSLVKIIKNDQELLKKYTWYIIPCADPDGAKLNEGWFGGGFTIKKYAYNFYRQINKQTEWSFPVKYKKYSFNKPTQQTRALMKLIDKIKPSLIYPLHNAGFSGTYLLLSKNFGEKYFDAIRKKSKKLKIPMHHGEPETPFMKEFSPSFFKAFGLKEVYIFFEKNGLNPLEHINDGDSSIGYARKYKKKPYWHSWRNSLHIRSCYFE